MEMMNLKEGFLTNTSRKGRARLDSFSNAERREWVKRVEAMYKKTERIFVAKYYQSVIHKIVLHLQLENGLEKDRFIVD